MPTTTLLEPSDTFTASPAHASITVGDLIVMLQAEDADAFVHVAYRIMPEITEDSVQESDDVDFQPTSGIERRWYGGRKVVVVR